MTENDITVVIASIPTRRVLLQRAITSVLMQTHPAVAISIAIDHHREGAPPTRQRALANVNTPWVAFLDDDDEFMPEHLEVLINAANEHNADYVYSWFKVKNGDYAMEYDPVFPPGHFLLPWDNANPRQTTITTLVRTELAQRIGFVYPDEGAEVAGQRAGEDWDFTLRCMDAGAKIHHVVQHTWYWHHDSGNTSGLPTRW